MAGVKYRRRPKEPLGVRLPDAAFVSEEDHEDHEDYDSNDKDDKQRRPSTMDCDDSHSPDAILSTSGDSLSVRHLLRIVGEQTELIRTVRDSQLAHKRLLVQQEQLHQQRMATISSELRSVKHQMQRIISRFDRGEETSASPMRDRTRRRTRKGLGRTVTDDYGEEEEEEDDTYHNNYDDDNTFRKDSSRPRKTRQDPPEGENAGNVPEEYETAPSDNDDETKTQTVAVPQKSPQRKSKSKKTVQQHIIPFDKNPWVIKVKQEIEDETNLKRKSAAAVPNDTNASTISTSPVQANSAKKQRRDESRDNDQNGTILPESQTEMGKKSVTLRPEQQTEQQPMQEEEPETDKVPPPNENPPTTEIPQTESPMNSEQPKLAANSVSPSSSAVQEEPVRTTYAIRFPPGPLGLLVSTDSNTRIGCFVSGTVPERIAASLSPEQAELLQNGDRILSVNGHDVENASFEEIVRLLASPNQERNVTLLKGHKRTNT